MGRKKKIVAKPRKVKISSIDTDTVKLLDKPSNSFCEACNRSDLRKIKDSLNLTIMTLHMVASATDIKYSDLESLCKKIKEWATKEYNSKMSTLLRGRNKKKDIED